MQDQTKTMRWTGYIAETVQLIDGMIDMRTDDKMAAYLGFENGLIKWMSACNFRCQFQD
jgi:hypothetical protein